MLLGFEVKEVKPSFTIDNKYFLTQKFWFIFPFNKRHLIVLVTS